MSIASRFLAAQSTKPPQEGTAMHYFLRLFRGQQVLGSADIGSLAGLDGMVLYKARQNGWVEKAGPNQYRLTSAGQAIAAKLAPFQHPGKAEGVWNVRAPRKGMQVRAKQTAKVWPGVFEWSGPHSGKEAAKFTLPAGTVATVRGIDGRGQYYTLVPPSPIEWVGDDGEPRTAKTVVVHCDTFWKTWEPVDPNWDWK